MSRWVIPAPSTKLQLTKVAVPAGLSNEIAPVVCPLKVHASKAKLACAIAKLGA